MTVLFPRRHILRPRFSIPNINLARFRRLGDPSFGRLGVRGQPWGLGRGGAVAGPSPLDVAGLEYWFKADAITGLSDTDPVATWPDDSGNNRDATQAVAGLRPTYRTNVQNGLPIVRGDGVNDVLACAAVDINWGTVFMVFGDWTFTGGAEAWGHVQGTLGPVGGMRVDTIFITPINMYADDNDLHENGAQTHIHRVDGAVTDNLADQNFHLVTLKSQSAVSYGLSVFSLLDSVLNANMQGDLCEVCVYNTILGAADETFVEGLLQDKWATPALP